MPKDDIFRLIYTILKELYEHKKEGTQTPLEDIGPERLCIPVQYWVSIICDLIDEAYISGAKYRKTKTGKAQVPSARVILQMIVINSQRHIVAHEATKKQRTICKIWIAS